jgi:hypothetical protein
LLADGPVGDQPLRRGHPAQGGARTWDGAAKRLKTTKNRWEIGGSVNFANKFNRFFFIYLLNFWFL